MNRKWTSIMTAAILTGVLMGSMTALAEEKYTVAMITYSLAEEFGVDVLKGAQEKADELGVNLEISL